MIVGVTGGAGFVGSWVCDELRAKGHTPVVFDHRGRCIAGGMLGDVRDATAVHELAAHVDGMIHLAAVLGTAETIDNPLPSAEINIMGTLNVFEACARYDLPVVFAAVGNSGIGRGTYCVTKTCGEQFVDMYRQDRGLRVTAVRPMNAFGPRQSAPAPFGPSKVRKIVPTFTCQALTGRPVEMYGDGSQVSDVVWVGDVARVFVAALEAADGGVVPDHPVDVGQRDPWTVREVAQAVGTCVWERYGRRVTFLSKPMRPGEPSGGPLARPSQVQRVVDAVSETAPALSGPRVARTVKQLGTAVFADTSTLDAVGVDVRTFRPVGEAIDETVGWFASQEGATWRSPA